MTSSESKIMELAHNAVSQVGELRKDFKKLEERLYAIEKRENVWAHLYEDYSKICKKLNIQIEPYNKNTKYE